MRPARHRLPLQGTGPPLMRRRSGRLMLWLRQRTRWLKGFAGDLARTCAHRARCGGARPSGFLTFADRDRWNGAVGAGASLVLRAGGL